MLSLNTVSSIKKKKHGHSALSYFKQKRVKFIFKPVEQSFNLLNFQEFQFWF